MGVVVYREPWWDRFRLLIGFGIYLAVGAMALAGVGLFSSPNAFVGWTLLISDTIGMPLAVRRALPGSYVRLVDAGIEGRAWRGRPVLVPWSEIRDIEVVSQGRGREGYRYPRLIMADGTQVPLFMLRTALGPSSRLSRIFDKASYNDRHFEEKIARLRQCLAQRQNLEAH
jgi:hypothetical protein